MSAMKKWIASGAPWIWLDAAAVTASLLLVAGLLSLIAWRGLGHFWPSAVNEWVVADGSGEQVVLAGLKRQSEEVDAQRLRESGLEIPDDMEVATRTLLKVGNRDLTVDLCSGLVELRLLGTTLRIELASCGFGLHELLVERRRTADRQRQAVDDEGIAFGEPAKFLAERAADVDPVLRRDFHEIDVGRRIRHQLVCDRPPQAEAGAGDGVL